VKGIALAAQLRAVADQPGGKPKAPARRRTPSISTAAKSGDRRRLLAALRDAISKELDAGVPPRDLASLSKRLVDIAVEIEAIDAEEKGDDVGNAASTPDEAWPLS
jgi:hypothetical protein